jgi:hypothetical protein
MYPNFLKKKNGGFTGKSHSRSLAVNVMLSGLFVWWDWNLNSGLHTCKAGTLLLAPHLQFIVLWLFWRWGSCELFAQACLKPRD